MPNASSRPGFMFLICPDTQILLEKVAALGKEYAPKAAPWKQLCFWGEEAPDADFWGSFAQRDLFGNMRLVLVRQASKWPAQVWQMLDKALGKPLSGSWPLFCLEDEWDAKTKKPKLPRHFAKLRCLSFAEKKGWVWRNEGLTDKNVQAYVQSQAKIRGLALAPDALQSLCFDTPRHAGIIAAELDKLVLLVGQQGGKASLSDLGTAHWTPDSNVIQCVNILTRGDARALWRELANIQDMDAAVFGLLGMLARTMRILWQLHTGDQAGYAPNLSPEMARRIGLKRIAWGLGLVMEAELSIKSGKANPRQVIELLLSRLVMLFATQRPQPELRMPAVHA